MSFRRNAYLLSRLAGDWDAAKRGTLLQRLLRRWLTRGIFRYLR